MKKITSLLLAGVLALSLMACGASFDVSSDSLKNYATEKSGKYGDLTSDYKKNYDYLNGLYIVELSDGGHAELWVLSDVETASSWFQNNTNTIKEQASSSSSTTTSTSGKFTATTADRYYTIMFCDNQGLYVYGPSEDVVNTILSDIGAK